MIEEKELVKKYRIKISLLLVIVIIIAYITAIVTYYVAFNIVGPENYPLYKLCWNCAMITICSIVIITSWTGFHIARSYLKKYGDKVSEGFRSKLIRDVNGLRKVALGLTIAFSVSTLLAVLLL